MKLLETGSTSTPTLTTTFPLRKYQVKVNIRPQCVYQRYKHARLLLSSFSLNCFDKVIFKKRYLANGSMHTAAKRVAIYVEKIPTRPNHQTKKIITQLFLTYSWQRDPMYRHCICVCLKSHEAALRMPSTKKLLVTILSFM